MQKGMERQASDAVLPRVDLQLSPDSRQRNRATPTDGAAVPKRNDRLNAPADLQHVGILKARSLEALKEPARNG